MNYGWYASLLEVALVVSVGLFFGMLVCMEVGRRIGGNRMKKDSAGFRAGVSTVEGAVFALLGLLIAFTFSGAASRFDVRRQMIIEETNDIGTAYLRLEMLPKNAQTALREQFRQYVDARLAFYRQLTNTAAAAADHGRASRLQQEIWQQAVAGSNDKGALPAAPMLLLPALNAMFDIATTRTLAMQIHPPEVIFLMLLGLALASALLVGYGMADSKERNWLHMLGLAFVMSVAIYVILDIEYPRFGFIRVDAFDQALVQLRDSMK
jgi:hypothetical protein